MKNWFKRVSCLSNKNRTYVEDEQSLFFDETFDKTFDEALPGEPERRSEPRSSSALEGPARARQKPVERAAKHK